jgi:hypothetical protein
MSAIVLCLPTIIFSLNLTTVSIEVPYSTTQHGNIKILCSATTLNTKAAFFIDNFVAHILTIKSTPGETLPVSVYYICGPALPHVWDDARPQRYCQAREVW